jgi:hypothetical protein
MPESSQVAANELESFDERVDTARRCENEPIEFGQPRERLVKRGEVFERLDRDQRREEHLGPSHLERPRGSFKGVLRPRDQDRLAREGAICRPIEGFPQSYDLAEDEEHGWLQSGLPNGASELS